MPVGLIIRYLVFSVFMLSPSDWKAALIAVMSDWASRKSMIMNIIHEHIEKEWPQEGPLGNTRGIAVVSEQALPTCTN